MSYFSQHGFDKIYNSIYLIEYYREFTIVLETFIVLFSVIEAYNNIRQYCTSL